MKHLKTHEGFINNVFKNAKYRSNRNFRARELRDLADLGFKDLNRSTCFYDSIDKSKIKSITVQNKYHPEPELDPGEDIFKIIIIYNTDKKEILWLKTFDEMIEYVKTIIPEMDDAVKKYNM